MNYYSTTSSTTYTIGTVFVFCGINQVVSYFWSIYIYIYILTSVSNVCRCAVLSGLYLHLIGKHLFTLFTTMAKTENTLNEMKCIVVVNFTNKKKSKHLWCSLSLSLSLSLSIIVMCICVDIQSLKVILLMIVHTCRGPLHVVYYSVYIYIYNSDVDLYIYFVPYNTIS